LIRSTFRYAGRQRRDVIAKAIRPIYTAVNAAKEALDEAFDAEWGQRYPAAIRLWRNAWEECIPFLDYSTEIRRVICLTNAIEMNARYRRAVRVHGHFLPSRPMKCLYLVTRSLDPDRDRPEVKPNQDAAYIPSI
jgi:transposase-like protein